MGVTYILWTSHLPSSHMVTFTPITAVAIIPTVAITIMAVVCTIAITFMAVAPTVAITVVAGVPLYIWHSVPGTGSVRITSLGSSNAARNWLQYVLKLKSNHFKFT